MIAALTAIAIVAAGAWGRRIQGGFFTFPSSLIGRAIYAVIVGLSAWAWTGNHWLALATVPAWYAACCISLLDSTGEADPIWRGMVRGALWALPAALVAIAFGHFYAVLWPALGAFMGPAYKLAWVFKSRIQPTVVGEYATGALLAAGMLAGLR